MKLDIVFGLEGAAWPALLVEGAGVIRQANRTAIQTFGPKVAPGTASLSAIWLAENEMDPAQFLARAEEASNAPTALKLSGQGGMPLTFQPAVCSIPAGQEKLFLVQLMPLSGEAINHAAEAGLAHKQKLDCALQLARTVALDFNNALTSILGHTSLILSRLEPDSPWRTSLVEVEKSASKAAEVANDLANFSRQEKETKVQQAGNINLLLERNVDTVKATPASQLGKEIEWSMQLERRLYTSKFDEAKMQQAFLKILENAIEALGPRGRIVLLTKNIDLTQPTQDRNAQLAAGIYVCVEISDDGCGIEAEVLPRIFEPFFTTKRSGKHRGLGLAWVYGIVTNHGGGVAVSSRPGIGTSVRVYLPAEQRFVKEDAAAAGDLSGTQTILIVDDEDLLLTMGETILSAYGYRVLTANSGQKALDILSRPDIEVDLVVTDLVMPGMSGRELEEHVRALCPGTRVLRSSGYVRPTGQESDETTYLQKPFTSQDLLLKVKKALATS